MDAAQKPNDCSQEDEDLDEALTYRSDYLGGEDRADGDNLQGRHALS